MGTERDNKRIPNEDFKPRTIGEGVNWDEWVCEGLLSVQRKTRPSPTHREFSVLNFLGRRKDRLQREKRNDLTTLTDQFPFGENGTGREQRTSKIPGEGWGRDLEPRFGRMINKGTVDLPTGVGPVGLPTLPRDFVHRNLWPYRSGTGRGLDGVETSKERSLHLEGLSLRM